MTSQPSGADLARIALAQAKAAAKARGDRPGTKADKTRRNLAAAKTPRGTGREPSALAGVLTDLADSRGWQQATTGGDILGRWNELVPDLAPNVQAVHYDPERRRLDLLPASPAFATGLRLMEQQLIRRLNGKLAQDAVRGLRILPPAHGTLPAQGPGATRTWEDTAPDRLPDVGNGAPPTPAMLAWRAKQAEARTQAAATAYSNPFLDDDFGRLAKEDEAAAKRASAGAFRVPDPGEDAAEEEAKRIRERDKAVLMRARAEKAARTTGGVPARIGDPQPIRDTTAA